MMLIAAVYQLTSLDRQINTSAYFQSPSCPDRVPVAEKLHIYRRSTTTQHKTSRPRILCHYYSSHLTSSHL